MSVHSKCLNRFSTLRDRSLSAWTPNCTRLNGESKVNMRLLDLRWQVSRLLVICDFVMLVVIKNFSGEKLRRALRSRLIVKIAGKALPNKFFWLILLILWINCAPLDRQVLMLLIGFCLISTPTVSTDKNFVTSQKNLLKFLWSAVCKVLLTSFSVKFSMRKFHRTVSIVRSQLKLSS